MLDRRKVNTYVHIFAKYRLKSSSRLVKGLYRENAYMRTYVFTVHSMNKSVD